MSQVVTVAYSVLVFEPQGIAIEVVHANREVRRVETMDGSLGLTVAPSSTTFGSQTRAAVKALVNTLGIAPENLEKQNIAYRCPNDWTAAVKAALVEAGCPEHDLLTVEEAEAICFFEEIAQGVLPLARMWRERLGKEKGLRDHLHRVTYPQLESALDSLERRTMKVALVGTMKAGKSTFINALLGQFVLPALTTRCTRRRFVVRSRDSKGSGRRVQVLRRDQNGRAFLDPSLEVDVDDEGWTTKQLRAYLCVLNTPEVINGAKQGLDVNQLEIRQSWEALTFRKAATRDRLLQGIRSADPPIVQVELTHPLFALGRADTDNIEIWDTPGPDGIDDVGDSDPGRGDAGDLQRSDQETFQAAVREASAVVLLFDVTKYGGQAQHDVVQQIVKIRDGRTDGVLVVANKLDQFQTRDAAPVYEFLKGVNHALAKQGLRVRPIVPLAARLAQIAREVTRSKRESIEDIKLEEEFDRVTNRADLRENPDWPEIAVERRSNIQLVEECIGRFFRREGGRSILTSAIERLIATQGEVAQEFKRELGSLLAEASALSNAAAKLEKSRDELAKTIKEGHQTLSNEYIARQVEIIRDNNNLYNHLQRENENHWRNAFKEFKGDPEKIRAAQGDIEQVIAKAFERTALGIREHLESAGSLIAEFWNEISNKTDEIATQVDAGIGVTPDERRIQIEFDFDSLKTQVSPEVTDRVEHRLDVDRGINIARKGLKAGAAFGGAAAVGAVALAVLGPGAAVAITALEAAALFGIGTGAGALIGGVLGSGAGAVTVVVGDRKQVVSVDRKEVIKAYHDSIEHFFARVTECLQSLFTGFDDTARKAKRRADEKLDRLHKMLEEARTMVDDQQRATRIEQLRSAIDPLERDLLVLESFAARLGIRFFEPRSVKGSQPTLIA